VYFASGASREAVKLNPHLEIFRDKGVEVLYLFEPIDEFLMDALRRYKDLPLTSVETADLAELDAFESQAPDKDKAEELSGADQEAMSKLLDRMKAILGDRVTEVRLSRRLKDSPCCLVSPDGGMSSSMQKIMQIVTRDASIPAKAMEVNQDHALVRNLLRLFKADPGEEHLRQAVEQMFEASLLLEGYLADPHAMVERTMRMLEKSSGWLAEIKGV
jgi:molecular chaperone HtpG